MNNINKIFLLILAVLLFSFTEAALASDTGANINGTVSFNGTPVCAMILANGQYMFTCSGNGSFDLDVPLDANGEITVFAFCSGLAPHKQIIRPDQGDGIQIEMVTDESGLEMNVSTTIKAVSTTKVMLEGTINYNDIPVCAMALANGEFMFSCSGDGSFNLLVPLDDMGSITLFSFCDGLAPYQTVYTTSQIDFNSDFDNDGYTVARGDCDDLNAEIYPGSVETCDQTPLNLAINTEYIAADGMTVILNSLDITEKVGSYLYQINYTLKNTSTDVSLDEATFKLYFSDGTGTPQYGFFGILFPGDSRTRSYSFEELKSKIPTYIGYHNDHFFNNTPPNGSLLWGVTLP